MACQILPLRGAHLLVGAGAVIAQDQVRLLAVKQQVGGFEGHWDCLDSFTEVKSDPEEGVAGVCKDVLQGQRERERESNSLYSNTNMGKKRLFGRPDSTHYSTQFEPGFVLVQL